MIKWTRENGPFFKSGDTSIGSPSATYMVYTWASIFAATLQTIAMGVAYILPQILLAILLVILGAVVGAGLGRLINKGAVALRLDQALETAGIAKLVRRTGHELKIGALLSALVQWFIILVFVVAALDVLKLDQVNMFLREVVLSYLPRVIVAMLIMIAAAIVAQFVHTIVSGASRAAEVSSHYVLGTLAKAAIWSFAILAALHELRVAQAFVETLFTGIVVALSLAVGLSFGLGGRDAAARYIDHLAKELKRTSDS